MGNNKECEGTLSCRNILFSLKLHDSNLCHLKEQLVQELIIQCIDHNIINFEEMYNFTDHNIAQNINLLHLCYFLGHGGWKYPWRTQHLTKQSGPFNISLHSSLKFSCNCIPYFFNHFTPSRVIKPLRCKGLLGEKGQSLYVWN